jgi:hypothetical protein
VPADHRLECSGAAKPDILRAGVARDVSDLILFEHIINKARTIHSAGGRIVRAVFVIEVSGGEFQSSGQKLLHFERIIFETLDLIWQQRGVRSTPFFRAR